MSPAPSQLCFCSASCLLAPGSTNIPSCSPTPSLMALSLRQSSALFPGLSCFPHDPGCQELSVPRETTPCWDVQSREELGLEESSPAVECSWAARDNGNDHGNSCCPCPDHLGMTSAPCSRWSPVLGASPSPHRCPHPTRTMHRRDKGRGSCSPGSREEDRTFLTDKDHVAFLLTVVLWLPAMPRAGLERYPKGRIGRGHV